jgi:DNA-directed RNA polymerase I, II, and III subunit RPABC2
MASIIDGDEHEDDASSTSGSDSGSESELAFKFPIDEFDSDPELDDEEDIENEDIDNNERGNEEKEDDEDQSGFHDDVYDGEFSEGDDSDEEHEEDGRHKLQKFEKSMKTDVIATHHPEIIVQNHHDIEELCLVIRDENGVINDPQHRTLPFITKYEKAKLIGERATQINAGATPFIEVDQSIIDGYLIALAEFEQKKIPMIIRRPLPNNHSEYWRLADLEIL